MPKKRVYYPLTAAQRSALPQFIFPKREDIFLYLLFSVSGACDVDALKKAFWHLTETEDALRLRLHIGWRGLSQYVAAYEPLPVPAVALRDESELADAMRGYRRLKNTFFGAPLCRAVIFTYASGASLFMVFSHLCFDGFSYSLAEKQLRENYFAYADGEASASFTVSKQADYYTECRLCSPRGSGETPQAVRPRYTYEKYCAEQREAQRRYRGSERKAEDIAYWRALLRQKPYVERFLPPPTFRSIYSPIARQRLIIDGALYASMADFCRTYGVSVPYFLAATAALLAKRLTGKSKLLFTGLSHGRSTVPQKRIVGMMARSFPTVFDLSDGQTLSDYYVSGFLRYLEDLKHSEIGIYRILLDNWRVWASRGSIPNATDVYFGAWELDPDHSDPRFSFRVLPPSHFLTQFYLLFYDDPAGKALVRISYQSRRYSEERVAQLIETYRAILAYVVSHPGQTVAQLMRGEVSPEAKP